MRAMVLDKPRPAEQNPLTLRDVPLPDPGPGEIRIRVRCCGVCRTDLHIVEGDLKLPKLPVIPGHQVVGIVDAAGPAATLFRAGWAGVADEAIVLDLPGASTPRLDSLAFTRAPRPLYPVDA